MVIGVLKDFHFESLKSSIEPLAFYFAPRGATLSIRVAPENVSAALDHVESTWNTYDTAYPFSYSFLDEKFASFYHAEQRLMLLLAIFSGLAIIIACLGLFGLASFLTQQRTKETGIRKILGASIGQIVLIFLNDFSKLLTVSFVLALPVAFLLARSWLESFAYRIEPGMGLYIMAAGLVSLITVLSVTFQPIRAAMANPVESLRNE
jgi:putative ABC transport system permease protein